MNLDALQPEPAGFGNCAVCAYLASGTAAICHACAARTTEALAADCCPTCRQAPGPSGACRNYWCSRGVDERFFSHVDAVATRSGRLQHVINRYKFEGKQGWAIVFGRILVGHLDEHAEQFADVGLITAMPAWTGAGAARKWDHVGLILERAAIESEGRWPFDVASPRAIIKTGSTTSMVDQPSLEARRHAAVEQLLKLLEVPDPTRVAGKHVVVLDDVLTTGTTLRVVAYELLQAGAAKVSGLVLARQPWQMS